MTVLSINPLIVILDTYLDAARREEIGPSPERSYWVAQISTRGEPRFAAGLRWFSPDLKQRPTPLPFSQVEVAEIALPNGKLTLWHTDERCETLRV
jgi:hypothetical protein